MAIVEGLTKERMLEIEAASIVDGEINGDGHLILTTHGGDDIDAGYMLESVPDATTTVKGIVELATEAETTARTDSTRAVTPASLAATITAIDDELEAINDDIDVHEIRIDDLEAEFPLDPRTLGMTGEIRMWPVSTVPTGWQICDGSAISRSTYSALYTVLGDTYGAGDGTTTFNVPNLKGRVPVGFDASQGEFDTTGETGGAKTHTLSSGEMPSHTHANGAASGGFVLGGIGGSYGVQGGATYGFGFSSATTATGGGGAHNNLQPYIVMRYIIKL